MKNSHTTIKIASTACRAITIALLSSVLTLDTTGTTTTAGNGDLPEFELPSYEVDTYITAQHLPRPIKVEAPSVRKGLVGTKITMSFSILKSGKIGEIGHNAGYYDNEAFELALIMNRALRTWKFEPARDNDGNAISVKVKMPMEVVPFKKASGEQLANIALDRPVIVAIAER